MTPSEPSAPVAPRSSIDLILERARQRLTRLTPAEAARAAAAGAVLVDIRPERQRAEHGALPGAVVIERNVLEWRLDPASDARLPIADYDLQVLVCCQDGYASSLAAASLQDLGVSRATDVVGGQTAWRNAQLTGPDQTSSMSASAASAAAAPTPPA